MYYQQYLPYIFFKSLFDINVYPRIGCGWEKAITLILHEIPLIYGFLPRIKTVAFI